MKNLIIGFLISVLFGIYNVGNSGQTEIIEMLKIIGFTSMWLGPMFALFIYVIQFAGIPLINNFIKGDFFERLLILAIVLTFIALKVL